MNLRNLLAAIVKHFFHLQFGMPPEQKGKHRSGACRTCKSGVCHDCCSCRRKTCGRPSQIDVRPRPVAYPTNAARHRHHSAPAVHVSTFIEPAIVRTYVSASATAPTDVPASATIPTDVFAGATVLPAIAIVPAIVQQFLLALVLFLQQ